MVSIDVVPKYSYTSIIEINHLLKLKLIFPIYIAYLIDAFNNHFRYLIKFLWRILCINDGQYIYDDIDFKNLIWFDVYFKEMFIKIWHFLEDVIVYKVIVSC